MKKQMHAEVAVSKRRHAPSLEKKKDPVKDPYRWVVLVLFFGLLFFAYVFWLQGS